jgi:lipopolysaccharide export system permease protein
MIGITLSRYFFLRYIGITFWFMAGLTALVFIVSFTELSDRLSGLSGYSIGSTLFIASLQTPLVVLQSVPFIGLVSGMATLISLNRKYELVVARSAGISAWQFLTPICVGALVFGLFSLLVLNPIAANGFARGQFLETELRDGHSGGGEASGSSWIKQRTDEGETIIGARTVLDQGLQLAGATFLRISDDGRVAERIDAERAFLRDGYWEVDEATRLAAGEAPEPIGSIRVKTNLTPEFVSERLAIPDTVPIYDLPRKIDAAQSFGLSANAYLTHFHSLVAIPALLVAMTLIAATVSMRFARMGQSITIILGGIAAGFLLYVVSVLVKAFGVAGFVPPIAAAWFPVLIASFFGVTFLLYKEDG